MNNIKKLQSCKNLRGNKRECPRKVAKTKNSHEMDVYTTVF